VLANPKLLNSSSFPLSSSLWKGHLFCLPTYPFQGVHSSFPISINTLELSYTFPFASHLFRFQLADFIYFISSLQIILYMSDDGPTSIQHIGPAFHHAFYHLLRTYTSSSTSDDLMHRKFLVSCFAMLICIISEAISRFCHCC